jgi:hypothetical protein
VRIVLDHYNKKEYSECVKRVLETVKFRKMLERARDGKDLDVELISTNHDRSFSDDWLPSWKMLKASLLDEWNQRNLDKTSTIPNQGKGKHVLPVAMGGVKLMSCYGCGLEGHKKGDPGCKAGKLDAHVNAPQDYKDRMAKKKKTNGGAANPGIKSPGKPGGMKGKEGEKKHCHAFNFGKGNCRYGAKCKFLHEKEGASGGKEKAQAFTPQQKKLVTTLLSSAMKRTAVAIAKKSKQNKKKLKGEKKKAKEDSESDNEEYSSMLASCFLAPIANTIKRDYRPSGEIVMASNLHDVKSNCGIDSDAGMSISTVRSDFAWLDESDEARNSIVSPQGINGGSSQIAGRGPMVIRAQSGKLLIDPDAICLADGPKQPNFVLCQHKG